MEEAYTLYKNLTKLDFNQFLKDFNSFVSFDYPIIVGYFSNRTQEINKQAFDNFDKLEKFSKKIAESFHNFHDQFKSLEFWEMIEQFDTIKTKIQTIKNTPKWIRSNKVWGFDNSLKQQYALAEGQTLERLSKELGYADKEQDWSDIALDNDMWEETYTSKESEKLLKVTFKNSQSFVVNTVVDNITGKNIYGKDVDSFIQFVDNDLKILNYDETINQSCYIKINAVKGSIPQFPERGISKDLIGSNRNMFRYGTIFRELTSMFEGDGRFKSVTLIDVVRDQDNVSFQFKIETKLGDVVSQIL